VAELLTYEKAVELARQLKAIPNFPWDDEVVAAHARHLIRWCKGAIIDGHSVWCAEAQGAWLVTQAQETWDKWRGTAALLQLFQSKFCPTPPPSNEFQDLGERPPVRCVNCNDSGIVGEKGRKAYCQCETGEIMRSDEKLGAKWLLLINKSDLALDLRPRKRESAVPLHRGTEGPVSPTPVLRSDVRR